MAIKIRDYEVRLTRNKEERKQVRQLRYRVFVEEEGASATEEQRALGEEYDAYDRFAEYMAVFHNGQVVGTYRIIDRNAAEKMGGFYTESEFNISKIKKYNGNIAEMSRACVEKSYRENALVMRMLWAGLGEMIMRRKIEVLFGVASFVGTKPAFGRYCIQRERQNLFKGKKRGIKTLHEIARNLRNVTKNSDKFVLNQNVARLEIQR